MNYKGDTIKSCATMRAQAKAIQMQEITKIQWDYKNNLILMNCENLHDLRNTGNKATPTQT